MAKILMKINNLAIRWQIYWGNISPNSRRFGVKTRKQISPNSRRFGVKSCSPSLPPSF